MSYPDPPTHTPFGQRLRERTQPLALDDETYGYAHAYLSEALSRPYREVQEVFDPEGDIPPVAPLLDPDLCPDWALPWLAQLVGLTIPAGTPVDVAREMVRTVSGFARGTPAALRAAAGFYLTGDKTVFFRERDGDPYAFEVVTLTDETPDPEAVLAALMAQKPGGLILSYRQVIGWDYQEMTTESGPYSALPSEFADYRSLAYNERL